MGQSAEPLKLLRVFIGLAGRPSKVSGAAELRILKGIAWAKAAHGPTVLVLGHQVGGTDVAKILNAVNDGAVPGLTIEGPTNGLDPNRDIVVSVVQAHFVRHY